MATSKQIIKVLRDVRSLVEVPIDGAARVASQPGDIDVNQQIMSAARCLEAAASKLLITEALAAEDKTP